MQLIRLFLDLCVVLPFDEANTSRAVIDIVSGSDGQPKTFLAKKSVRDRPCVSMRS